MIGYCKNDALAILSELRRTLTNAQGQITDLITAVSSLSGPENRTRYICDRCGVAHTTAEKLADHLDNVHGDLVSMIGDALHG